MNKKYISLFVISAVLFIFWFIYSRGNPITLPANLPIYPTMPISEEMCDDNRIFQLSKEATCIHTKTDARKHRFYKVECKDFTGWVGVSDLEEAEILGEKYTGQSIYYKMREEYCPWKNKIIKK